MLKNIECYGSPYDIGKAHGSSASDEIRSCIDFYAALFLKYSHQTWEQVQETARVFEVEIKNRWPKYYEEMLGIANGSRLGILDIVALNVRTEIAFGLFSDGCTSLFWHTPHHEFLGQNWDWQLEQKTNLIYLTITQPSLPTIKMITEAGMIGKIGINSVGVGVCLNAIRAIGLDSTRIPVHLGLRAVLECNSAKEAVEKLEQAGMASSAHMLIADGAGFAIGLEFTSSTFARLEVDEQGRIAHSNHLLLEHGNVNEPAWLEDSPTRVKQMHILSDKVEGQDPGWEGFSGLFEDQTGFPASICRAQGEGSTVATLFNIVMDLKAPKAVVKIGRPCDPEEVLELTFDN